MPVEVCRATASDAPGLRRLIEAFRDHLKAEVPTRSDLEVHLPAALADPSLEFICARIGEEFVGYAQLRFFGSIWAPGLEARLEDLFVQPAARRRSVGRTLLRHALARASARGASRFTLTTNDRNEAAHALYRSEALEPVSHALYPGSREILWGRDVGPG